MRYLFSLILFVCFFSNTANVHGKGHRHKGSELAESEVELMNRVLICLNNKDTFAYYTLFPSFDTIWRLVMHNPDNSPDVQKELNELREHPQKLINYDPYYNTDIIGHFIYVLQKGEDSGIHWNGIVMQRFELHKQGYNRDEVGLERVIPERFKGYIFVRDLLGSTTYCISIKEIQKIKGYYFGGQLSNILEANDIEQFHKREHLEVEYFSRQRNEAARAKKDSAIQDSIRIARADSMAKINKSDTVILTKNKVSDTTKKNPLVSTAPPDEESNRAKKEVVDRKYYEGKFDEEVPVKLYVRYMKDGKTGKVSFWDALYKFGDQKEYVKLDVNKNAEGHWLFEEPIASMELELKGKVFTGSWTNNENQTGYDVVLNETSISTVLMDQLEQILEQGTWGKTNAEHKEQDTKKEMEDRGNDSND